MERRLVIEAYPWETRVGITEDGRLVEVFWENPHATVGKIFTGIVRDIVPGLSCAFVDIGLSRNAFLFVGDTLHQGRRQELRIQEVLKRGQPVLVQVKKEPSGDKGARVTQEISLPGNHLVLLPHQDGVYVSRKITDSQGRAELKRQLEAAKPPGMGVIARTTSGDASREELLAELQALVAEWLRIVAEARQGGPPRMVYGDVGVIERCLREYLDSSTRDIVTNDEGALATVQQVLAAHPPVPALTVRLEPGELFARYGLEKEIKRALQPRVWLKHGGYLVIE
ncbi:MAG: ribonuclease E/G, partial [Syntrophomonadaceae bacterium]|nr:ribonuclease E/G [Syntrophomonadaceae bacterium]